MTVIPRIAQLWGQGELFQLTDLLLETGWGMLGALECSAGLPTVHRK